MQNGQLVPLSRIAKSWGFDDTSILKFLTVTGVEPEVVAPYGKGSIRLYKPDTLNLRAQYTAHRQRAADENAARLRSMVATGHAARRSKKTSDLARVEAKLDAILKAFNIEL